MSIISLGIIDKRLLFPLAYIIVNICVNIYWEYQEYNIVSFFIESFGYSIGQMLGIILSKVFKYRRVVKHKKTLEKNYFKDFFFLSLFNAFYFLSEFFETYYENYIEEDEVIIELYINDAIEIIFITLITYFFLKYKYYKHHFISIAAFILFSSIIDISLKNFSRANVFLVINSIIYVFSDSLLYSYYKYLFQYKYYYLLDILVINGIICLAISVVSFIIILFIPDIQDSKTIITLFSEYYDQLGIGQLIIQIFLCVFLSGFLICFLELIILNELTPNYVIIGYELGKIPISIFANEGVNRWIVLIVSIFQIISLLFYLEIFECNFCSLNNNTKRSISERGQKQEEDNGEDNEIIYKGYDISEMVKQTENNIELEDKETKYDS